MAEHSIEELKRQLQQAKPKRGRAVSKRDPGVTEYLARYSAFINARPMLLSLLYDIDMLPEQTVTKAGAIRLGGLCEVWRLGEEGRLPKPPTDYTAPPENGNGK